MNKISIDALTVGAKIHAWTVIQERRGQHILCQCNCGFKSLVIIQNLLNNKSKQCKKCYVYIHGMTRTPTYRSWMAMHRRCKDKIGTDNYRDYGSRGIGVCDAWNSFEIFYSDMGKRPDGMTIDRIDNDLGYFKDNCRWATNSQQGNNKRRNRCVIYKGETYTASQLAVHLKMNNRTLFARLNKGIPLDREVIKRKSKNEQL